MMLGVEDSSSSFSGGRSRFLDVGVGDHFWLSVGFDGWSLPDARLVLGE